MEDTDWESTWAAHASAFDRVRSVVMAVSEPRSAGWIADRARVAESTARDHLTRLAGMGTVTLAEGAGGTRYAPDPAYVRFREIRELTTDHDPETLGEFVVELKTEIDALRRAYDAESPRALRAAAATEDLSAEESRELLRAASDWEHYAYRLSLLEDAISRYDEFTGSPVPA